MKTKKTDNSSGKPYAGITGKLGQDKLRSKYNLKSQAQLHTQSVKKEKKLSKAAKELKIARKEKARRRQENMPVRRIRYNFSQSMFTFYTDPYFLTIP